MFGQKKQNTPRPLNDSGRSQISETFSLEGTLRTSGAIDISGLIKGAVYADDLIIKETGSIIGPVEADKIEIYGHLEGKILAKTIVIGSTGVVKGDILFSESLKTEEGADINGYLKKRVVLDGIPKQNFGNLYVNAFGGFAGYISRMRYFDYAVNFSQFEEDIAGGPSLEMPYSARQSPPYLTPYWWTNDYDDV